MLLGLLFVLVVLKFFVLDLMLPAEAPSGPGYQPGAHSSSSFATPGMPTLVELGTDWCGPCRTLRPVLLQLQREYAGRAEVVLLNPEKNAAAQIAYRPRVYPTLVFHNADGSVHKRLEGAPARARIVGIFKEMGIQ
ncbi:putative thioredoxin [Megalodesulfovibrio gigas DSM 1382 = ATCC 19364]|uniref:Putative thioredoxin n=2 Tax=Megalodesulfovibrio gigas TaxID=879 RepID=T2GDS5_MEGG1|nr:putative thioredoxin [Megalodesulfovibrio gigas DSM 1382 = ATCC 19364]